MGYYYRDEYAVVKISGWFFICACAPPGPIDPLLLLLAPLSLTSWFFIGLIIRVTEVADYYHTKGFSQHIARGFGFENITLLVRRG